VLVRCAASFHLQAAPRASLIFGLAVHGPVHPYMEQHPSTLHRGCFGWGAYVALLGRVCCSCYVAPVEACLVVQVMLCQSGKLPGAMFLDVKVATLFLVVKP
jgi:hypothetical protein